MGQNVTWAFKRGDEKSKTVWVSASLYAVGGKLFFAAKPQIDSDSTDSSAIINKTLTDDDIVETNGAGDKGFRLLILGSDTKDLQMTDPTTYNAEFQYVTPSGAPVSFPDDNTFFLKITPDIKIGTS